MDTTTARVLFVDDEAGIRITLAAILQQNGFQVTVAATVAEALALITAQQYDVVLSDLNIGQPGDGFTVVSAVRRVQPKAITLILTGYPAFDSALRAIREQVDDFLIKPTDVGALVQTIRGKLANRGRAAENGRKRLFAIIAEHKDEIIDLWYRRIEQTGAAQTVPLSRTERIDHLPAVMDELVRGETPETAASGDAALRSAAAHGTTRRKQRYTASMLIEEARVLNEVISDQVRQHLLTIDISFLLVDLGRVSDRIYILLELSMGSYLSPNSQTRIA